MEKKMRIQLFDSEGRLGDDRMVTQDPEVAKGPKFQHSDPIRVEFTLLNKDDVEKCVNYLQQLSGILPLTEKKAKKAVIDLGDNREEVMKTMLENATDQDNLIEILREAGFKFMMYDYLETLPVSPDIKSKHQKEYQFMIRCLKEGRNPATDKYDPMLVFGIKLIGERTDRVLTYLNGVYAGYTSIEIPEKPIQTFKKSGMIKFPHYMEENEREKFRFEMRKLELDPEKNPSKFFVRWFKYVENLPTWVGKRVKDSKVKSK